jgi:hypothetical protein
VKETSGRVEPEAGRDDTGASSPSRYFDGEKTQHTRSVNGNSLRRRPPCVQTYVVLNAIVKTQGSYRCEILRENVTADVPVSTKVRNSSSAGYGAPTQRRRHDKLLRESGLQAPVRAGPLQSVLRAILLDQVPRGLQTSAGAQQGLLAMALQMSRAFGRGAKIIRRRCLNRRGLELSIACAGRIRELS